ncbi:hypothetical protein [Teredinibacter turnerae]|uniref:hypothetical protein n=1 Tax=Teredinibacter turnerae TaxID=2426 RepID=UPI0005F87879|nr:hypothetical protein [Teredinibacter turnerae]
MSYETLDRIADSYIPLLVVCCLISVVMPFQRGVAAAGLVAARFVLLVALVAMVYIWMFADAHWAIWPALGRLDYSTHTALALVLVMFLWVCVVRLRWLWIGSFIAYLLLMRYQAYHTFLDMLTTALVLGMCAVGVLYVYRCLQGRVDHF